MPPKSKFNCWEDYVYPGTDILKNKLDIRDAAQLRQAEYQLSDVRSYELQQDPIPGKFDLEHLKKIHGHIFQDVYEWAGETRNTTLAKGNSDFSRPEHIESWAAKLSADLAKENHLKGLDKTSFVDRLTHHYAEFNALHPFREGNGRATREFMGQLAKEAGYTLDQTRIDNDKGQWNKAAARSYKGDLEDVKAIFRQAIRPTRAIDFEQLPKDEALAKHPELKGVFERQAAMREEVAQRYPNNPKAQVAFSKQIDSEIVRYLDTGKVCGPLEKKQAKNVEHTSRRDLDEPELER